MLLKNSLKKIKKSFGRYLSLLVIILIGVGFYAGIKESIPNISDVQTKYYIDTNLMDLKLLSTLGFNDEDVESITKLDGVDKVIGSYSQDVLVNENVLRIHAIEEDINQVYLINGKLPIENNECLADYNYYKVGDKITVDDKYVGDLDNKEYKVVGTIISPIYTSNDYGSSNIGNGKLYSFIYIPKENFKYDFYTEVYVTANKNSEDVPYSESYNKKVKNLIDNIDDIKNQRLNVRIEEIVEHSYGMIDKNSLQDNDWYILSRDDVVSSYTILESQYNQVTIIANVIPLFFILIVVLMTSNTMARMITEERSEMGTLLSLGYNNKKIINNYLLYVLSATILGSVIGYFIGTIFLPQLVYNCFSVNFPNIRYQLRISLLLISILVSCLLMVLVTIYSCKKELKQKPAYLLRPIAPQSGKKIFLEKINFIWSRLSFSSKITIRNISRYKNRGIMTLVGTAGCTFLIMIGFALKDSINSIGDKQYAELFKYDNLMILKDNINKIPDKLSKKLDGLVDNTFLLNQSPYKVVDSDNRLDIYMIVPESTDEIFYNYFTLKENNSANNLKLNDDGVIITPKIQKRFNIAIGDTITIESLDNKIHKVKVSGIAENYVSNYIYMSKDLYKNIFEEDVSYNVIVSKNIESKDEIAKKILELSEILSINFSDDLLKTANEAVQGLNNIVILLVIISSLLAFTVLYNLTSINISERTREIATLKVLGFKDSESNEYIYRETLITVIVGIIVGLTITPPLHGIVMDLLETDTMVFLRLIEVKSYIFSGTLTFIFALIMQMITYFKLKKINMIESLKSVE